MDTLWSTVISALALVIAAISAFAAIRSSRASKRANALADEANSIAREALEFQTKLAPPVWSALEKVNQYGMKIQNTSGEALVLREVITNPADFQHMVTVSHELPLHVSNGDFVTFSLIKYLGPNAKELLIRFSRAGSDTVEEAKRLIP